MIGDIGKLLTEIIEDETVALSQNTYREIVENTPVDTGHAVSNWILSKNKPFPDVVGSKTAVNHRKSLDSLSEIQNYKVKDGSIFLTNNVNYVPILNAGSSTQAPAGFVQIGMDRAIEKTKS